MKQLHLHLLSDSTGETLDIVAKACLAQFDEVDAIRHFWPMVRSRAISSGCSTRSASGPGWSSTLWSIRRSGARSSRIAGGAAVYAVSVLDPVIDALSAVTGEATKGRPGRQHAMDAAYFARVDAIQFTIAHDDGISPDNWEEADIVLTGVSRTSKTPTAIYLANRGYKVANVPLVRESPPPPTLFNLKHPLIVGLTTNPERLIQIRRNRLLALNQPPETDYVDVEAVERRAGLRPAHLRRQWLAGDRRHPPLDRGDGRWRSSSW